MQSKNYKKIIYTFLLLITGYALLVSNINASTIDELNAKIAERNKQIAEIQKEIDQYQQEIDKNAKEANTLKKQINLLEITKKKLASDISLTQKQIESAELTLEDLGLQIQDKEKDINGKILTLAEIIRNMNDAESTSLVELVLSQHNFSDFFGDLEQIENFQKEININLTQLQTLKKILQDEEAQKEAQKNNLENFKSKLVDQKQLVDINKTSKNKLLQDTKNKETTYKKLLADQLAKEQALQDEISAFEEQIRITIEPSSLPKAGSGILQWPVDNSVITQYFGDTPFATQNPQVYGGKGHDGIDLRASVGTPIKAARLGVVMAIGNTVSLCRGYQIGYGKWVLIKHDNNLSTFYAHLSLIKVSPGDSVKTGQLIGYSGNTGYTTGPHLHFGVFATQAISGLEYTSTSPTCGGIIMHQPIVPPNGKLNPLSYL